MKRSTERLLGGPVACLATLLLSVLSWLCFGQMAAAELRVGLAEADITPPLGIPMVGYSAREGTARAVLDRLLVQAVVLDDGETSVALIALDLRRLTSARILQAVRSQGFDHVILAASHTHSGPDTSGPWRSEPGSSVSSSPPER